MEAWRYGFDLPPAHKFDPTDADIVAYYLLPRAIGYPNPHGHAIIDGDPYSCPPWELMRRYKHGESDHAFFFGPPRVPDPNKKAARAVAPGVKDESGGLGGTWDGQRSDAIRLVLTRGGDGGDGARPLEIMFRRGNFSYYHGPQKKKTSGWVMHEYQIIQPPHLSSTVLSRVRITRDGTKKRKKEKQGMGKQDAGGGDGRQVVLPPGPDQPGPSNYYDQPGPDQPGPSNYYNQPGPSNSNYYGQPVGGGGEYGGGVMGDTPGGCCYVGGGGNSLYEGYGSGGGDCFAAGDDGSYGNGDVIGETGGFYGDGSNHYLNQDYGGYLDHGDDRGGGCFDVGDNNSFDYEYHDGGNGG